MKLIFFVGIIHIYYSIHAKFHSVLVNGFGARNRWRSHILTDHISTPNFRTENLQIWSSDSSLSGIINHIIIASLLYNQGRHPKLHFIFLVLQFAVMIFGAENSMERILLRIWNYIWLLYLGYTTVDRGRHWKFHVTILVPLFADTIFNAKNYMEGTILSSWNLKWLLSLEYTTVLRSFTFFTYSGLLLWAFQHPIFSYL